VTLFNKPQTKQSLPSYPGRSYLMNDLGTRLNSPVRHAEVLGWAMFMWFYCSCYNEIKKPLLSHYLISSCYGDVVQFYTMHIPHCSQTIPPSSFDHLTGKNVIDQNWRVRRKAWEWGYRVRLILISLLKVGLFVLGLTVVSSYRFSRSNISRVCVLSCSISSAVRVLRASTSCWRRWS